MKLNLANINTPLNYSLIQKDIGGTVLSALKKAETEDALIVRLYNASETNVITNDRIHFTLPINEWLETRMDETPLAMQNNNRGEIGETTYCHAKTFRVRF